jgi:phosphonate degradation associated HDIG domain protein
MTIIDEIVSLLNEQGQARYGMEAVSQREHALQAAWAAEKAGVPNALVAAALLHDVGHLLHDLPEDAAERGINDHHETAGQRWLVKHFDPAVTEPVRLHVDAKRYLCAMEPAYNDRLSPPSAKSLELQGGPFNAAEVAAFEAMPFCKEAVQLRRWDDEAKVLGLDTPDVDHFRPHLEAALSASR